MKIRGFTLIELLIVVAIIAILAAIAVPNFLEAQTRAKVSRGKADMRTVVTALEVYRLDTNSYPSDCGGLIAFGTGTLRRFYGTGTVPPANYSLGYELTTPISYLTTTHGIKDPFRLKRNYTGGTVGRENYNFVNNEHRGRLSPGSWTARGILPYYGPYVLCAAGPDGFVNNGNMQGDYQPAGAFPAAPSYDSTNGTVSIGDIYYSHKFTDGNLKLL